MATGSTASSGTDGPDPQDPREADEAAPSAADAATPPTAGEAAARDAGDELHDPARRAFFFQFGKQAVSAVGQVAGMANVVGRTSSAMANELLGLEEPTAQPTAFVRWGHGHGAGLALDGLGMLVEQAAESFFLWCGTRPETGPVIRLLRP